MRTVPAELADLIPLDAHDGVIGVYEEIVQRFPYWGELHKGEVNLPKWTLALSIWNARQIVSSKAFQILHHPPYLFSEEDICEPPK